MFSPLQPFYKIRKLLYIVIIVLFRRCRKKVKDNKDGNNEKGENLQILYPGCEEENKNSVNWVEVYFQQKKIN